MSNRQEEGLSQKLGSKRRKDGKMVKRKTIEGDVRSDRKRQKSKEGSGPCNPEWSKLNIQTAESNPSSGAGSEMLQRGKKLCT